MLAGIRNRESANRREDPASRLRVALREADAVIIGAGSGLSTSAGFSYTGERFRQYFSDFAGQYGFHDMYTGGFYPYERPEVHWAYWSRYIWVNRYMDPPKPVYDKLFALVQEKDYFVLTTNVDHCFQKAGFDRHRLFYTQGDYGLLQCSEPCHKATYDNKGEIRAMLKAQGFIFGPDDTLLRPEGCSPRMEIPSELLPLCPKCGRPMTMNLRSDDRFVEDAGWERAAFRYQEFLRRHKNLKVLFLELGIGLNTPVIIKYPFWRMTYEWPNATYACVNLGEAYAPREIARKSICLNADIGAVLAQL